MIRSRILLAGAAMLACAGCMGDKTSSSRETEPSPAKTANVAPATLSQSDRSFVSQAASGGLFEVQSSEFALQQQGLSSKDKEFAQMMVDDHGKANRELSQIAAKKGVTVPTQLLQKDQQQLDQLKNKSGADFVKQYRETQKKAHDEAIALFEKQARDGQDQDLKAFAEKSLPVLRKHRAHLDQQP
jgi:putative membrane protein